MRNSNGFFDELKIFIKSILRWFYFFAGFTLFFFLLGPEKITIFGKTFFVPMFQENTFTVLVFKLLRRDFMPEGVELIVTNPWSGFIVQLEIAILLSFLLLFPFFLYGVMKYILPALFEHEKKPIFKSLLVSTALFLLGCLFAYFYMIPLTFKFMYPFATSLGVVTFFSLDAFMGWTIAILVATGVTFLLPIFMVMLSALKIVSRGFWKRKWKHSFVFLLIFSAVITPDQTGITMILLFIPLVILYTAGALFADR